MKRRVRARPEIYFRVVTLAIYGRSYRASVCSMRARSCAVRGSPGGCFSIHRIASSGSSVAKICTICFERTIIATDAKMIGEGNGQRFNGCQNLHSNRRLPCCGKMVSEKGVRLGIRRATLREW
jgi:hypothetical protein